MLKIVRQCAHYFLKIFLDKYQLTLIHKKPAATAVAGVIFDRTDKDILVHRHD